MTAHVQGSKKRAEALLELELQVIVSCIVGIRNQIQVLFSSTPNTEPFFQP